MLCLRVHIHDVDCVPCFVKNHWPTVALWNLHLRARTPSCPNIAPTSTAVIFVISDFRNTSRTFTLRRLFSEQMSSAKHDHTLRRRESCFYYRNNPQKRLGSCQYSLVFFAATIERKMFLRLCQRGQPSLQKTYHVVPGKRPMSTSDNDFCLTFRTVERVITCTCVSCQCSRKIVSEDGI